MKRYRDNKIYKTGKGWQWLLLIAVMLVGVQVAEAQELVTFKQRTAAETPNQKIYNIKGDFQMIGNTNLTLSNYSDDGGNESSMKYVDIDGDPQTLNSSSATLQFSTENGAVPDCSNIIYAGLYWTGRAHNGTSAHTFNVTKSMPGAGAPQSVNNNQTVTNGSSITYSEYSLSITRSGNNNNRTLTYTFTTSGAGDKIAFIYAHNNGNQTLRVSVNDGTATTVPTSSIDANNAYLQTPYVIYNKAGGITLTVSRLQRDGANSGTTGNSVRAYTNVSGTYRPAANVTKAFDKSKVYLKHANQNSYTTIQADVTKTSTTNWTNNIYFPRTTDGYMYSAYAEVTDYVRDHGLGEYFVADIALAEGDGGATGFYGGWGMIVVYENSKMKWRDITIFDGHAYVAGSATVSHILGIDGFNTAQDGDIEMKLGIIAGEGDVSIEGDYFQILPHNYVDYANDQIDNDWWVNLSHSGNSANNFFNGSIPSTAPRNPEYKNNTGLDIAMFNINNPNNSIIKNEQTKTKFRYGSTQDTYIISTIAMAVDAYVPDVEANNDGVQSVNGNPVGPDFDYTVHPNDVLEFKLEIRNKGTEAVNNLKLEIPVPFSGLYVPNSATATYKTGITPQNPEFTYDGSPSRPGTLTWNIGNLPYGGYNHDPDEVLATLTYKIKITDNCAILTNTNCTGFSLVGTSSGVGAVSGVSFSGIKFITGYNADGVCQGEPILGPYNLNIEVSDELLESCGDPEQYNIALEYCDITKIPMSNTQFDVGVKEYFPDGSRFWSAIEYYVINEDGTEKVVASDYEPNVEQGESPVYVRAAAGATEYTELNPFPPKEDQGTFTYYAIPPGFSGSCFWRFTITVKKNCANYWVGTTSNDWGTQTNWSVGLPGTTVSGEALPNNVIFATADNNKGVAAKENLHINGDRTIVDLTNDSEKDLVVTPGHQLKITGEILSHPDATGSIIVQAHKEIAAGTFIVDPGKVSNVNATVQFYNKAYTCTDCGDTPRQEWQYFGIPVVGMNYPTGLNVNINKWDEKTFGDKWIELSVGSALSAFTGYEINDTRDEQQEFIYQFAGKLNIGDAEIPLSYTESVNYKGWNLIGNSYTAAIPIATAISYTGNWNSTVYLFNTGSRHDWRKLSGNSVYGLGGGRYQSVPLNTAGQGGLPSIIPSMHAFMIKATSAGKMTLDYSKLTKNTLVDGVAWRSSSSQPAKLFYIVMDVIGSQSADRVWLFEKMTATRGFDAGWDGEKMAESGLMQLYVAGNDDLKLQVATVPQLHDTYLGLSPDNNENISISFSVSGDVEPRGLHLRDMLTGRTYPIRNNAEYTLPGAMGENSNRFKVVTIAQGDEGKYLMADDSLIEIFVLDNRIGVSNKTDESGVATVYDITGKVVAKQSVERNATAYINSGGRLPDGVYVVKVKSGSADVSKRIMIK